MLRCCVPDAQAPLSGIVADEATAAACGGGHALAPVTKLNEQAWWMGGKNSAELKRSTEAYLEALGPTLSNSRFIMFIDPHLDPTRPSYNGFAELLRLRGPRNPSPKIEVHRVCYSGSGRERQVVTEPEWKLRFEQGIGSVANQTGLKVEVSIWDDFHDRYLISNLIGILMPNGFDTEGNPSVTRWARLDREHRDNVEREFHTAAQMHSLRHRFEVG